MPACSEVRNRNEPGSLRRDQRARQFAREVKAGVDVDRAHLRPRLVADGHGMIGLAPRRRRAVNEMRHPPDRRLRMRQQRIAGGAIREVADEGKRQFRPRRGFDRLGDRIRVDVGEHGSHALPDQGLRDGAADAVARAGDQSRLARGVEWSVRGGSCCR